MDMAKEDEMRKKGENKIRLPPATIDPALLDQLNAYCAAKGLYRSNVVEKALEEYLKKHDK